MKKNFDLVDVIQRSAQSSKDDVLPLLKYLDMDLKTLNVPKTETRRAAEAVAAHLRKMGSNDIATLFRGTGVPYDDVVLDVGKKLKAKVKVTQSVEKNEETILWKLFEDALEKMSDKEKRTLFQSMGIKEHEYPTGAAAAIVSQLIGRFSGFAVYKSALIVANMVSRALLGQGLALATNAALTRSIGALLGPIGWIASGLWLAIDIAGPAFRKTVPAVIHVAMLRQMLMKRITIGVVGDGSSGKDSLIHAVFGLKSNIDPVAGSTKEAMVYDLSEHGNAQVVNYPGFNDYRPSVNAHIDDYLHHTDVFVMVVDSSRGISGSEVKILENLKRFGRDNILICLNKVDLARDGEHRARIRKAAEERLSGYTIIETAFDPDPRLHSKPIGCAEVYKWIEARIRADGKAPEALPKRLAA
jgi:uncharacterized protein YaaW (UPF0174 family)/GTPase SAR1 family protein